VWNRWGEQWAAWPKFSKLWAQIARWASRQSEAAAFDVSTYTQGGKGRIRIDAVDKNAAAINFMNVEGTLVTPAPRYESRGLRLTQTGPGRYEGEFDASDPGSYIINLAYRMGTGADAVAGTLQTGVSVAYSPEYKELSTNLSLLKAIADRTGGRELAPSAPQGVYDTSNLAPAEARRAIWEDLIRLMVLLFLLDVAIRRIAINPFELARKARRFIAEMAGGRKTAEATAAVLTTLKGTREQVRGTLEPRAPAGEAGPAPQRSARYEAPQTPQKATEELSKALGGASETDKPVVAKPTRKPTPTSEADYTSRLLQAKKKARDKLDDEQAT
jgi:hypothetical protein